MVGRFERAHLRLQNLQCKFSVYEAIGPIFDRLNQQEFAFIVRAHSFHRACRVTNMTWRGTTPALTLLLICFTNVKRSHGYCYGISSATPMASFHYKAVINALGRCNPNSVKCVPVWLELDCLLNKIMLTFSHIPCMRILGMHGMVLCVC